jgi:exodeoxyribonuclease VII large subunit
MQSSFLDGLQGEGESSQPAARVYTVSDVTTRIKVLLEADRTMKDMWLEGEISNWKPYPSGHIYLSLKDETASIRCVVWRSAVRSLSYMPGGNGEAVLVHGHVSVYEQQGQYQFYIDEIQPAGMGALYAQFEQLKARLAAEGLFDRLKRSRPVFPQRIGVVTSAAGAALRDILNVLHRRYPLAEVILAPSQVQGADAPRQIVAALKVLTRVPGVDVIILARGGGSIEDLWAFNDETLARTLAQMPIPVISGVGHETDFTIADFAADERAPTPSAAAEMAVPDRRELSGWVRGLGAALAAAVTSALDERRTSFEGEKRALARLSPLARIEQQRQRLDDLNHNALRSVLYLLALQRAETRGMQQRLAALDPTATLSRGYAIVRREGDGRVVVSKAQVKAGDGVVIMVSDGTFSGVVSQEEAEDL